MTNTTTQKCRICSNSCSSFMNYRMPLFMGAVEENNTKEPFMFDDMCFQKCSSCGNVQIALDVSPDILYKLNHNVEVIGSLWKEHYIDFYSFIKKDIENRNILEISDPSAKIALQGEDYNSWTIIEPNPNFNQSEKIKLIHCFFDNEFIPNETYDVLIHSHFMEHAYDPHSFLKKCFDVLPTDGLMMFSIPNMQHLLKVDGVPNNILHFEHTYFYDRDTIEYLLTSNGFEILENKDYKSHSWFYKCRKNENVVVSDLVYKKYLADRFFDLHNHHISRINKINEILDQSDPSSCFLFGCHVNSQYYVQNGLSSVSRILDNSKSKQGKVLYGTGYSIHSPSFIEKVNHPIVVCSHTGPYFDEISKQLKQINPNTKIL